MTFSVSLTGASADLSYLDFISAFDHIAPCGDPVTIVGPAWEAFHLKDIDAFTAATVDASSVTMITGSYADIEALYTSLGITGLGNEEVTVSGTPTVAELNTVNGYTGGVVTASISGTAATLAGLSGSGNAYTVTLSAGSAAAADLNAIDAATTVAIDASSVTTITGALADVQAAYDAVGISGLGNEAVTLSDVTVSAADLNALDAETSGTINASSVTTITGALADVQAAYDAVGISGLGNEAVTLSDVTVSAADLNALDAETSGTINASSVTTITGALADVQAAYDAVGISGLGNEAVTLSDVTVSAADLNALDAETSGTINASSVTTITGALADVQAAYDAVGISGLGNEAVTLSDVTVSAADLNALDAETSGTINASSVTTITGALADVQAAYDAVGISGLGNEAVTLSDVTVSAADLNALDAETSGTINASSVTTITGALADVQAAYDAVGISGLGNEAVTLSDVTVSAADLNALDAETSGTINASSVTTITGSYADIAVLYTSFGISGLGNEAVTVSGTPTVAELNTVNGYTGGVVTASISGTAATLAGLSGSGNAYTVTLSAGSAAAADLNAIDAATTVAIDASSVTTITGALADVQAAYDAVGISGLGNEAVTLSDVTVSAADLNALNAETSGTINASSVTTITGALADVQAAYDAVGISGLGNEAVTLSDVTVSAADLNALNAETSGTIDASSVTTITGALADVQAAYDADGISGLGNEAVTLSDVTVSAADLNALDAETSGTINASSVTTITGALADVQAAYDAVGISGLGNEAVTLSDVTVSAADLNALDAETSGTINASSVTTITGALADVQAAYDAVGISGLGNEAVTLSDVTVSAADLNALDAETSGTINASSVTTITGSYADIAVLYTSFGISGLGNEAVTVSGTPTVAELNTVNGYTGGVVTASISGTAATLAGLSGSGNAYTVTLSAGSAAAADLNAIDAATTVAIDASSVTTITGALADVQAAYDAVGISGLGNEAVTLSDVTVSAADLNALNAETSGTINASSVTTITGALADVQAAYDAVGISGLGNEAVTLSDVTVSAADLNALDAETSGTINASSVTTITGALADVQAAYDAVGISGLGNEAVTLSDVTVSAADLNALDAETSGTINASSVTMITGSYADIVTLYTSSGISGLGNEAVTVSGTPTVAELNTVNGYTGGVVTASISGMAATLAGLSGSGNAYTVTLSAGSAAAADLNAIDAATTVAINASSVTTITGALADVQAAYDAVGISGLGNEAVTLSDVTVSAADLNALNAETSGTINASSVTTITGALADVQAAYDAVGISGLGNEAVTLSDVTVSAADLNALNAETSGTINASSVTTITGALADVQAAYDADGISGLGDAAVTLSDVTVSAADLNALDAETSGTINASSVTTITGALADVQAAYDAVGISGLGNEAVTLSDVTVSAADLNALNAETSGTINASSVTTITGALADVQAAYDADGISGLGNEAVTLSDVTVSAADLNALNAETSGTINASSVTTITGALADVQAAYDAVGISGLGNEAVTLSDVTVSAADLNALNAETSGTINASSVTTITGALADVQAAYDAVGISGLGNEAVTLSDVTVSAADLNALDAETSGTINASSVTTITGALADVQAAYDAVGISGLGNEAVTLSDVTVSAADLNALNAETSKAVNVSSVTTVAGALTEIQDLYAATGIIGLGNEAMTLSDATVSAADLNALNAETSGTIDASSVTTITGSYADIVTLYTSSGISGLGNEAVTVSGTPTVAELNTVNGYTGGVVTASISGMAATLAGLSGSGNAYTVTLSAGSAAAADLNAIDAATTVAIDASSVTTITGALADVQAAYDAVGISGLGNEAVTLSDVTVSAADLNALNAETSGTINASSVTTITGALADVQAAYDADGISGLGNEAVTLSDVTVSAADLNALNAETSGTINASSVTTITGALADVQAAYDADGISGLGNEAVTLSDVTVSAADLNALDAETSGTINASSVTTITGALADVQAAYDADGISGLGNEAVTLSDVTVTAAALNALDAETSGTINASSVTTITGALADVQAAYDAVGISGLGDEAVTLSDVTVSAADLNALNAETSGTINASSVTTITGALADVQAAYDADGISGLGNEAVTLSDVTVSAADLNALNAETSGTINASSVTTITGALADVQAAYDAVGISGLGNEAVTLSDVTVSAADLNALNAETSGTINASSVTTITGALADVQAAYDAVGISGLGNEAVTLSDVTVSAADLNALDAETSGTINASSVTTITGALADVQAAYDAVGISGLGNEAVTVSGTPTVAELNTVNGYTGGVVTASISGAAATLAGLSGSGNAYTVTLSAGSAAAADLNAIDAATTVAIDASSVTTITGALADVQAAYDAVGISGLGNEAVTLSDTVLSASEVNHLNASTSGVINVGSVLTFEGNLSDVTTAYTGGGLSGLGNEAVTLSDTMVAVTALIALDTKTSGVINASSVTSLTGTVAAITRAYNSTGISGLGNEAVTLSDKTVAVADLSALDAKTSGVINASSVTTLTGTVEAITTAYKSAGISGLGNEAVTLFDTVLSASMVNHLNALTSGVINVGAVLTFEGNLSDVTTTYTGGGLSGLGNEAVTLSDTMVAVTALSALDTKTSGVIDASSVTSLTGTVAAITQAYNSTGISGLGNEAVTVSGTPTVAQLNTVNGYTGGVVTASISGTAATLAGLSGSGNAYTVTLSAGSAAAADLNAIDAATTVAIDASSVTTITGALAHVQAAYDAVGISGLGNEAVTLSDTVLSASEVNHLNASTSGVINVGSVLTFEGNLSDVTTTYTGGGLSGLGNEAVTLSDTMVAVTALIALDTKTSGVINASSVTTLTGTVKAITQAYNSTGISGLGNEAVTLSDTTVTASALRVLDTKTSGVINASSVTKLSGTVLDVTIVRGSDEISGLGNAQLNVTGTVDADTIVGSSLLDTLSGLGGMDFINGALGNDVLTGGTGGDVFQFNTAISDGLNVDKITDFNAAEDKIWLSSEVFADLVTILGGGLAASAFALNRATGTGPQIVYTTSNGALSYDSNGSAAGGMVRFATLADPTGTIDHQSFLVKDWW